MILPLPIRILSAHFIRLHFFTIKRRIQGFTLAWFFLFISLFSQAQTVPLSCGTPAPKNNTEFREWIKRSKMAGGRVAATPVTIPLAFTILRPSAEAGRAVNADEKHYIAKNLYWLEKFYRGSNISFYITSIKVLANTAYYEGEVDPITYVNQLEKNAANVIISSMRNGIYVGYAGYAYYPSSIGQGSNLIVLNENSYKYQDNLLPHEIGHYLNLYHTFDAVGGNELVDGSNCATAGDMVCDTPADITGVAGISINNCVYTGTPVDAKGMLYKPDTKNLMSYWHSYGCQTDHFSAGQFDRAYNGYWFRVNNPGYGDDQYNLSASPKGSAYNLKLRRADANNLALVFETQQTEDNLGFLVEYADSENGPWQIDPNVTIFSDVNYALDPKKTHYVRVRPLSSPYYSNVAKYTPGKPQELYFDSIPSDQVFRDNLSLQFRVRASSGLPVSYRLLAGNATISEQGLLQIKGAGWIGVEISQQGNAEWEPYWTNFSMQVSKAVQQIDLSTITPKTFGDPPFEITATASSGQPVTYAVAGPATLSGNRVTINGAGQILISAYQQGNANYMSAEARQYITVAKANQSVQFDAISTKTYGDAPFTLSARASTGLPVTFEGSGPVQISGNQVTVTGAGEATILAKQTGNENYNAAPEVLQKLNIARAEQTVTLAAIPDKTMGDPDFPLEVRTSSGLSAVLTVSGPAEVVGTTVRLKGAGPVTITASQPGNENYLPTAVSVSQRFTVAKGNQTIRMQPIADRTYGDGDITVGASASSGLPVAITVTGPATIADGSLKITGAGAITVTIAQSGNDSYEPAASVTQTFTVHKLKQQISFDELANRTYGDPDFDLSARINSGLGMQMSSTGPVALTGTKVRITGAGVARITLTQPGDGNHEAAPEVSREFTIVKRQLVLTFPELATRDYSSTPFALQAQSNATLPVQYQVEGPAQLLEGNRLQLTGIGEVKITALQAGDANHETAQPVVRTFTVQKARQLISWETVASLAFGKGTYSLPTLSSTQLPVQYRVVSGPATVAGATLSFTDYGKVTVVASQPGDDKHLAAPELSQTFCVNPEKPTITAENSLTLVSSSPYRNLWLLGNDTLSSETQQKIRVTRPGEYRVLAYNPDGSCQSVQTSDSFQLVITSVEPRSTTSVTLAPNPARDEVLLQVHLKPALRTPTYVLYNSLGKAVTAEQPLTYLNEAYQGRLTVRSLPAGLYLVRITTADEQLMYKLIVNP